VRIYPLYSIFAGFCAGALGCPRPHLLMLPLRGREGGGAVCVMSGRAAAVRTLLLQRGCAARRPRLGPLGMGGVTRNDSEGRQASPGAPSWARCCCSWACSPSCPPPPPASRSTPPLPHRARSLARPTIAHPPRSPTPRPARALFVPDLRRWREDLRLPLPSRTAWTASTQAECSRAAGCVCLLGGGGGGGGGGGF
jgi:hypothetical protein